jgi:hypothetical protein
MGTSSQVRDVHPSVPPHSGVRQVDPLTLTTILATQAGKVLTGYSAKRGPDGSLEVTTPDGRSILLRSKGGETKVTEDIINDAATLAQAEEPLPTRLGHSRGPVSTESGHQVSVDRTARVAAVALAVDADAVFAGARSRNQLVFRLRLGIALSIAGVLVVGLAALVEGAVFGQPLAVAGGGALSIADLIGARIYQPIERIREAWLDADAVDLAHLETRQRIEDCMAAHPDRKAQIECTERAWRELTDRLAKVAAAHQQVRTNKTDEKKKKRVPSEHAGRPGPP